MKISPDLLSWSIKHILVQCYQVMLLGFVSGDCLNHQVLWLSAGATLVAETGPLSKLPVPWLEDVFFMKQMYLQKTPSGKNMRLWLLFESVHRHRPRSFLPCLLGVCHASLASQPCGRCCPCWQKHTYAVFFLFLQWAITSRFRAGSPC